ncbi:MAG: transglycosylase SLT domain-containing protein, partial [Muribaculaceae bacterium]|nr:transglycosylase SLT domain-containing protein [Muribaculaceae bacterium]
MADTIDAWCAEAPALKRQTEILQKYFDSRKNFPVEGASYDRQFRNGYASPFDSLFRVHADESAWDWRMLAAQAYQESRFDPTARSWAGAKGLMQIMPGTATGFGLRHTELTDPSRSIQTAVKILDAYDSMLSTKVTNPIERKKFTLAAYNAGPGHVLDAIRLAEKYGLDPQVWDDNVEKAMLMKMNRRYYRDPVVKYGYSRGRETVDYVK